MIRNWRRLLGPVAFGLGLVLAAQLAYGAGGCASLRGMDGPAAGAAAQDRCMAVSAAGDVCVANPQPIDARAAAAVASPPDHQPSSDSPRHSRVVSSADLYPRSSTGLAPGFPSPLHILFRRYLS